jgi:hypothetical protein
VGVTATECLLAGSIPFICLVGGRSGFIGKSCGGFGLSGFLGSDGGDFFTGGFGRSS